MSKINVLLYMLTGYHRLLTGGICISVWFSTKTKNECL